MAIPRTATFLPAAVRPIILVQINGITMILKLRKRFRMWQTLFGHGINSSPFVCFRGYGNLSTLSIGTPHLAFGRYVWTTSRIRVSKPRGWGGYSLYEGYYICSSVSTPLFQVSGKFVEFRPLYFSKHEENVVFWPLYFSKNEENVVFWPLFFIKIGKNV